jgi:hypothetical protein
VPAATIVTVDPLTVHTAVVSEPNETASPLLAVALTVKVPPGLNVGDDTGVNVMVCVALLIVMF